MTILAILAIILGVLSSAANFPQVMRIFKKQSAKDVSIVTSLILFAGAIIWVLYGFELGNLPVIITNILNTGVMGLVILGWYVYSR